MANAGGANQMMRTLLWSLLKTKRMLMPCFHLASAPVVGRLFRFLISRLKTDFVVTMNGNKMYLDEKDTHNLSLDRVHEPGETAYFESAIEKGNVVVDLGANIGYYTLLFARLVGPEGRVFAFEPEPKSFALLEKNVAINDCANVTLVNKAVSDAPGRVALFLSEENRGDHRIYDPRDGRLAVGVEAVRLDDYFADCARSVDVIKMDIQGAEFRALRGMRSLLRWNPAITLVTEFEPGNLLGAGVEPRAFLQLLQEFGFHFFELAEEQLRLYRRSADELLRDVPSSGRHVNLVCARGGMDVSYGKTVKAAHSGEDGHAHRN